MRTRTLLAIVLALVAGTAQAAPGIELRAGAVDLGAFGSTSYLGLGVRHRFDDTWAAYGDFDFTTSSTGTADLKFNRYGGGLEVGKGDDEFRVNFRLGVIYTDAEAFGISTSDTAPSYGVDFRFRRLGIGFSQTDFKGETVNSTSLAFYF